MNLVWMKERRIEMKHTNTNNKGLYTNKPMVEIGEKLR